MFARLSLHESFRFVANDEQWQAFTAYGQVSATDLWLNALAEGPGARAPERLDGYDRLWSSLSAAVKVELAAGRWRAEGFDPAQGARPISIPAALWPLLEFDLMEEGVVGDGFKFVGLLISGEVIDFREGSEAVSLSIGAKPVSLVQLLELVATPDERSTLEFLRIAAPRPRLMFSESAETEQDRLYSRLSNLENELWARARSRLSSGEWAARGLPRGAHALVEIIPELWTHLVCNFWRNEVHDPISGVEFHHVTIRQLVSPAREDLDTTPGSLRRSVKTFLRRKAQRARSPIRKDDLLLEAKAYVAPHVSRTMLDEVLVELQRAGEIPEGLLFKGRPPLKAPGK